MPRAKKLTWENTKDGDPVQLRLDAAHFIAKCGDFFIRNGIIAVNKIRVGQAVTELMHGYHPAVKVKVYGKVTWFEQDEPDLYTKIMEFTQKEGAWE